MALFVFLGRILLCVACGCLRCRAMRASLPRGVWCGVALCSTVLFALRCAVSCAAPPPSPPVTALCIVRCPMSYRDVPCFVVGCVWCRAVLGWCEDLVLFGEVLRRVALCCLFCLVPLCVVV